MAFNINTFRAKMTNGGARSNQFQIILTGPAYAALNIENFSYMCEAASFPSSTTGVIEQRYFGRAIKLPGDRNYEDWNTTIVNNDFTIRNAIERWHSGIASHSTAINAQRQLGATGNPYSYVGGAQVIQYDTMGAVLKTATLVNLWPVNVGAIELAWDQNDQIEKFQVTFAYDYVVSDSQI